ncbi:2-hydroxy-6-oxononadienedioate/2-hydroxy-6-oxononatrienedioate hydrolase [Thalassoglobus neptunius]|uniref:2-hydroxy-6-oxononadienedioate/2-hydroxy-6-oxononatrienedioate hydrolase n=1 Tax=Thalassoglobus neptunius TaxID=1938619 RepID=A0A5C5WJU4_9PLAN|nr:alpha/beta hydrolase [Thalassoglobus neptunius]TWT50122.1 2-hydroxy-6-oxononadienedioate/2-hydroxy-6-oxononatrienedioate hydrolase [Thalassoglobus neptunius]
MKSRAKHIQFAQLAIIFLGGILFGTAPALIAQDSPITGPSLDEVFLFRPSRFPEGNWNPKNLRFEDVEFQSQDGTKLHGWLCPTPDPFAHVLYLHGTGKNLSDRAQLLEKLTRQHKLTVMIFDYRGYGRSESLPTVDGAIADSFAARAKFAEIAQIPESEIVLMGRSLGGAMAIQIAAALPPRGMILESTFASYRGVAELHAPKFAFLIPDEKLHSVELISEIKTSFLISHGDRDRLIPFAAGQKLFRAAPAPKKFIRIPGADHNDPQSHNYYKALDRFLRSLPRLRRSQ